MTTTASPQNEPSTDDQITTEVESEIVSAPEETCPKCHTTTPWKASSWCPECGFYPGISDAIPESAAAEEFEEVEEEVAVEEPPMLPPWVVKAIAGPTVIIVASIAIRYYFTYFSGDRGIVALILFLLGLIAFVGAHIRTSIAAMNESPNLGPFDIISNAIEMWRPTIRGLPATGNRIVVGVCGVTALLSAIFIIGGIDFGSLINREKVQEDKEKPGVVRKLMKLGKVAKRDGAPADTLEEAVTQYAEAPITEMDPMLAAKLPTPAEPLTCVVYGYMKDGKNDFGRILLAADIKGKRVHVATIYASDLPKHARDNLANRLKGIVTDQCSIDTNYSGTWVQPKIGLPITFDSWSIGGELVNPAINGKKQKDD